MILIGYSGHAFVAYSILQSIEKTVTAYCDTEEKSFNPFNLEYLGNETSEKAIKALMVNDFVIALGDNKIRRDVFEKLAAKNFLPSNAIHASALIGNNSFSEAAGILIGAGVILNPLVRIGNGSIINTGAIIEHECNIGDFSHIGPGAILCGNVSVGTDSFVGAGAVIRQGIKIGNNVMIGAGATVVKNVDNNITVMGCPAK